ncbi:MAG: hypothetical protein JO353_13990 [Phycisphaerae bacterium]|nr:hypothetical protein [Phycisphaerae bacterium]
MFLALLFTGWGLAALSLHVVRTPSAVALIPKFRLGITDTYVDTRHWTLTDVSDHPAVVKRVLETGQSDLLRHITGEDGNALERQLADAIKHNHPRTTTTETSSAIDVDRTTAAVKQWWNLR